jgi:hypothetical protein
LLGLLGWGVSAAYGNVGALRERDLASRSAEALQQALRAFALHNARLPCPDLTGQGWEGNAAGQCPAGAEPAGCPTARWAWTCRRRRCRPATRSTATLRPRRRCRPGGAHRAHRRQPGQPRLQDVRDLIVGLNRAQAAGPSPAPPDRRRGQPGARLQRQCARQPGLSAGAPLQDRDRTATAIRSMR